MNTKNDRLIDNSILGTFLDRKRTKTMRTINKAENLNENAWTVFQILATNN